MTSGPGDRGELQVASAVLVVTTCSAFKRVRSFVRAEEVPSGGQDEVAERWLGLLRKETRLTRAADLYRGRAFLAASEVAGALGAGLGVVSAGLGYVGGDTEVPSYDLTLRDTGAASVRRRVSGGFDEGRWFRTVSDGPFSTSLADACGGRLVLACLTAAYARMVAADLVKAVSRGADLRIFGESLRTHLPASLHPFVMPYDRRLDGLEGHRGTRLDFPQRALRHFVNDLRAGSRRTVDEDRRVVAEAMATLPAPGTVRRRRIDDTTVRHHIEAMARDIGPGRVRMLRRLRSHLGVSCEQARFSRLYDQVVGVPPS